MPLKSVLKKAARAALHEMGGLAALRRIRRREFGVPMFHSFSAGDAANVEAFCGHVARHFEPVSLSRIVTALGEKKELPDNAITITVDDGYRNFFQHGHPIFRKHRIPTTLYVVAGFSDGRLWLWPDQIDFGLQNTAKDSIRATVNGDIVELPLANREERAQSSSRLQEALKRAGNDERVRFVGEFGKLCGVEIPPDPPVERTAMNWDELRAAAAEGVEIGCHTESHPILSRLREQSELEREIRGAGQQIEERVGTPVRHFCYPNGHAEDISEAAIRCVREAGYVSAVTCTWGLNTIETEALEIRRLPTDSALDFQYGVELLAGLHI
jgi:peptidoglycan/xylan/chitin deacetylase (PgdA/CDA1 family)